MSVKVQHSVTAKCKPEHAWQKFQSVIEWPWWNRVIGQAKWTEGQPWQTGSRMLLEIAYPKRLTMKPVVSESSAPHAVALQGDGETMRFSFDPQQDGQTLMKAEAEFSGLKTMFGGGGLQKSMQQAFREWLDALKTEAEKIAREELARS